MPGEGRVSAGYASLSAGKPNGGVTLGASVPFGTNIDPVFGLLFRAEKQVSSRVKFITASGLSKNTPSGSNLYGPKGDRVMTSPNHNQGFISPAGEGKSFEAPGNTHWKPSSCGSCPGVGWPTYPPEV